MNDPLQALPDLGGCPPRGGSDLIPLLLVAAVLIGLPWGWRRLRRKKGASSMSKKAVVNFLIVAAVAVAAAGVLVLKNRQPDQEPAPVVSEQPADVVDATPAALPTLIDLGANKCIPCKKMAPILEKLREDFAGRMDVVFHDVWQDPEPAERYEIRIIPTQIFLDPEGRELFRHEGFFSREEILGKWSELGYTFEQSKAE